MVTQSTQSRIQRYAPLLLWMGFIFLSSTAGFSSANTSRILRPLILWLFPQISEERIALTHFLIRKAGHFSEYAVLGFLAAPAFFSSSRRVLRHYWFQAAGALIISYALLDEFHQSFVSSRTASIFDSIIDIIGGLLALICFAYFNSRRRSLSNPNSIAP